jgi:hypothetical protein
VVCQENFKQNVARDLKKTYAFGLLFTQHEIEKSFGLLGKTQESQELWDLCFKYYFI